MSEFVLSFTCAECGISSTDRRMFFFSHPFMPIRCYSEGACKRRQKRNEILAEMEEMRKKPYVHPVDRFSRTALTISGAFLLTIIFIGLLFLNGF
ncbi:hypothetical protein SEA_MAKAI_43 [Arthrobacter phage Makai]|nr:hypothetical protein SEA_MAKAI_43 [Arthrobacter phage Makai]